MIKKPQGYDEAQAYTGESLKLPAGCYVCRIIQAKVSKSKDSNRDMLLIAYDIDEGEQKGFFAKKHKELKFHNPQAEWPGVYRQTMDGTSLSFFKGFITSVERSNHFTFPWDVQDNEQSLRGKKFGAVMGRKQKLSDRGNKYFITEIKQIRSLDGLKDATVPEDELLPDTPAPAFSTAVPQTQGASQNIPYIGQPGADGFMNIPEGIDDELPFN